MARVLNIIESITLGGASRSVFAAARYSSPLGGHTHSLVSLCPHTDDSTARVLATASGMVIENPTTDAELLALVSEHDIVLVHWWNSPVIDNFLRTPLPPCRLAAWFHVGGHCDPHAIPSSLIDILDLAIAVSPHTAESSAFKSLAPDVRNAKTALVYAATDFARLDGMQRLPHEGFNVGYIGTVDFVKMHPHFVRMSANAHIPDVRFIVCGPGGAHTTIKAQAAQIGRAGDFDVRGMVHDICPVLSILDAYGYPLCEDNYAASELNLQEVMFCGIPPVVFAHGGVKHLVMNDYTGYIVHSEREYAEALEHLHVFPNERARIGRNAQEYARQIFGAEHAARRFDPLLEAMMRKQKRSRPSLPEPALLSCAALDNGARRFLESLVTSRELFLATLAPADIESLVEADERIIGASTLMRRGGIRAYRNFYRSDPMLCFWSGLALLGEGQLLESLVEFTEALKLRFPHWRAWWYTALIAQQLGQIDIAQQSLAQVRALAPDFLQAKKLQAMLSAA